MFFLPVPGGIFMTNSIILKVFTYYMWIFLRWYHELVHKSIYKRKILFSSLENVRIIINLRYVNKNLKNLLINLFGST